MPGDGEGRAGREKGGAAALLATAPRQGDTWMMMMPPPPPPPPPPPGFVRSRSPESGSEGLPDSRLTRGFSPPPLTAVKFWQFPL
ncbi:ran-binding protein 9-like [Ornithorhynchus anatinus]|uniref:ran-binding protein 9-like n=1 Tax=Ornithorhynchus anatinus TaxID=9258 RepID=UPI0010A7F972|nr:ran-binding protein 9-like [Ornithorhynchus anatinus]